jgi:hypothetical protein
VFQLCFCEFLVSTSWYIVFFNILQQIYVEKFGPIAETNWIEQIGAKI